MNRLKLDKIGNTPVLIEENTNTKTSFKGGYQDVVIYINRFKLVNMVDGLNELPVFFYQQLEPQPMKAPILNEAHIVQFTPPSEGGLS